MKKIERNEVMALGEYEMVRAHFRDRVIAEKKLRRLAFGPKASCVFENRDTVLLQIQEMLRTERITREAAIQHEIDTYNELVPGDRQLSATIMIEIDDKAEREDFLSRGLGMEKSIAVEVDGERSPAEWDVQRVHPDHLSAVLYLKFTLSPQAVARVKSKKSKVAVVVDHAAYSARAELPAPVLASVAEDFA